MASGVVSFRRERPPVDYLFRIDSFSQLKRSLQIGNKDAFESTEFVAQGYTWVLSIYPNGNKNDAGEDHLSFYLKMVRAHDQGAPLTCIIKFFVYDHKLDNYLVVQNIHERRFHALKNEWGISTVLKLSTFTDAAQGFLNNDSCMLGVEIYVIHLGITRTTASLSLKDTSIRRSYTWKIDKFSELRSKSIESPVFTIAGYSWMLFIYPKGDAFQLGKNLSLFLKLCDGRQLAHGEKLLTERELILKDQHTNSKDYKITASGRWFCSSTPSWGYSDFISIKDLQSPLSNFIKDDSLIVEVNMISVFLLSDTKPLSGK